MISVLILMIPVLILFVVLLVVSWLIPEEDIDPWSDGR